LDFEKRKKRTYSFTGHLITPDFNTQLPEVSTSKSPTSNILLRNAGNQNVPNSSEWITLGKLRTELQWSLSKVCELISTDWGLNFC